MVSPTSLFHCFRVAVPWLCAAGIALSHAQQAPLDAGALSRQIERELPAPAALNLPIPGPNRQEVPTAKPEDVTVVVQRFHLTGVNLLPEHEVQAALQPWLHKPLTFEALRAAGDAVENLYRMRGHVVQVNLPPQSVQGGEVTLTVIEAKLGAVIIDTPQGSSRFGAQRAASYITWANPKGQSINLADVSRAIVILNETPGVSVTSALEAGTNEGETDLRIALQDTVLQNWRVEANNHGSRTTGAGQGLIQGSLHNPSGYGDQLTGSGIQSMGSTYAQAGYHFPLSPSGLRGSVSASSMHYRNVGEFEANGGRGQATVANLGLAYPWLRSQEGNANLTASYEHKTYLNHLIAAGTVSSSYRLRNLVLGVSGNRYDQFMAGAISSAQLNLVAGHLELLPDNPANFGTQTPSQFTKLTYALSRVQTIKPDASKLQLTLTGQVATQNLNSAEQFYLGGPFGVRAYPVAQAGGAQGWLASVEYQHQLPDKWTGIVFLDAGRVQQYKYTYANWQGNTQASNSYGLYGTGVGLRWARDQWTVSTSVAWKLGSNPLHNQQGLAVDVDNTSRSPRLWLSASYSL
jgi:hemolysin activation/secretion protein